MKAKDIMIPREKVVSFGPDETLRSAVRRLAETGFSGAPVVEKGMVVGVLSESDIVRELGVGEVPAEENRSALREFSNRHVGDVMTKGAVFVGPEADVAEVARAMVTQGVNRLVVVDYKMTLLGLIARGDVIRAALQEGQ